MSGVDGDPSAPLVSDNLNPQCPPPGQRVRELTLGAERQRIDHALKADDERCGHRSNPPSRLGVRARLREPGGAEQACQLGDRVFLYVEAARLAVEVTRDVMRTVQAVGGDTHVAGTGRQGADDVAQLLERVLGVQMLHQLVAVREVH